MAIKKQVKSVKPKAKTKKPSTGLAIDVYNLDGKVIAKEPVAKDIFAVTINPVLEAMAIRVYLNNQRLGTVSTKTRGEVSGSTKKLFRQKGTGRARQGSRRAPHRVGGGVVFGPRPREFNLKLPKKAKRKALFSALSSKFKDGSIIAINDVAKLDPKTKLAAQMIKKLPVKGKKLIVLENNEQNMIRAIRNLEKVNYIPVANIGTYNILVNDSIIFSKNALKTLHEIYLKESKNATE